MADDLVDDFAFRFQYADKSAFHVYANGEAFIVYEDGRREKKSGVVVNRIPRLIGMSAKPRQDKIDELSASLATARRALEEISEFCSVDASRTGAVKTLAFVRNKARAALASPAQGGDFHAGGGDGTFDENDEAVAEPVAWRCPHDMGFDNELGPLGCRLVAQNIECVCENVPFAAALAQAKP